VLDSLPIWTSARTIALYWKLCPLCYRHTYPKKNALDINSLSKPYTPCRIGNYWTRSVKTVLAATTTETSHALWRIIPLLSDLYALYRTSRPPSPISPLRPCDYGFLLFFPVLSRPTNAKTVDKDRRTFNSMWYGSSSCLGQAFTGRPLSLRHCNICAHHVVNRLLAR